MVIFGGFGEGSKMGVFGHFGGVRGGVADGTADRYRDSGPTQSRRSPRQKTPNEKMNVMERID